MLINDINVCMFIEPYIMFYYKYIQVSLHLKRQWGQLWVRPRAKIETQSVGYASESDSYKSYSFKQTQLLKLNGETELLTVR